MEVSLIDILNAREERSRLQQQLLQEYGCPLICFTMNIAGPIKTSPLIQRGFQVGLDALLAKLPADSLRWKQIDSAPTGSTAMLAVDMDAHELKSICIAIEEASPLGRLFDMDVLATTSTKLERGTLRGCMVCGAPGRECAASRRHSVPELQEVTTRILREHFKQTDANFIASMAVESLIGEVNTTPKPGLVDRRNNGSHLDMTITHFLDSAEALRPYFAECVRLGQNTAHLTPVETFPHLRAAGLTAEKAMYQATGGINTHKGAIYTIGILCGSIGRLWAPDDPIANTSNILEECGRIAAKSVKADLSNATGSTAGEKYYLRYGVGGIRSEVANGLPSVRTLALPCYEQALNAGLSQNDAGAITLINLIANVADTNLYHRGGETGAKWAAEVASALLPFPSIADIEELDDAFIARNLSPGGCADLLAVTYFLHKTRVFRHGNTL